jgi:aminoglycoside phosphotransferase family enzyme/predicted kinase
VPDSTAGPDAARLAAALLRPACYPHPVGEVRLLQTHISWVFLAGEHAYKVKKPVSLGFADFATLEARRFFCEEELRLNRRTAPDLYEAVVPITGSPDAPAVGGGGPVIEWAVKMRRFPQEALLDRVARTGALTPALVDAFAQSVAAFHAALPRAKDDSPFGTPREIRDEAVGNFAQIEAIGGVAEAEDVLRALRAWTERACAHLEAVFQSRRDEGFVRECHGDLHLGNVALIGGRPVAFDAIEFNEAFRWIDVMNEVAFPVMDLVHHGLPRLARRFLDRYLAGTGDYEGLAVLRFYLVYRAMVRAKVSAIRSRQAGVPELDRQRSARAFGEHVELAAHLSRPARAAVIAMHGLSGSGKTTAAQELLESLGAIRIRSDVERKRLHGLAASARTGFAPGEGLYAQGADDETYARLVILARQVVAAGHPVIVDATSLQRTRRETFRELAQDCGVPFVLFACVAPQEVLRERVVTRAREGTDASEAGLAVLERQIAHLEPLAAEELEWTVLLDTAHGLEGLPLAMKALEGRIAMAAR